MSSPRSSSPKKGRKYPPSKKLSRGKRVPRCEGCGKHDGDDVGEGMPGAKVRLKICARCRATAYCSMECQKARWERHRLKCRKPEDVPPPPKTFAGPSPRSRQGSMNASTVRRKVPPMTQTPRNREKVPTRHPFFPERPRDVSPPFTPLVTPAPIPVRERRQHLQPQTLQEHHEQEEEDRVSCPSPPTMQRLSMPGDMSSTSRQISKHTKTASASKLPVPEHSPFLRVVTGRTSTPPSTVEAEPRARSASGDRVRSPLKSPQMRPGTMYRRSTYSPETLARVTSSGLPSRRPNLRPGPALHRRESAPIHPASLEDKGRTWSRRFSTDSSRERGPPPPYSYALSRRSSPSRPVSRLSRASSERVLALDRAASPLNLIPPPVITPSRASFDVPLSLGGRPSADQYHGRPRGFAHLRRSLSTVEGTHRQPGTRDTGERKIKRAGSGAFWMNLRGSKAEAMLSRDAEARAGAERQGGRETPMHVAGEPSPSPNDDASLTPAEGQTTERDPDPPKQAELQTLTTEKVHQTHVLPDFAVASQVCHEAAPVESDDQPPVQAVSDSAAGAKEEPGAHSPPAEVGAENRTEADDVGDGKDDPAEAHQTEPIKIEEEPDNAEEEPDGRVGELLVPLKEQDVSHVQRETLDQLARTETRDRAQRLGNEAEACCETETVQAGEDKRDGAKGQKRESYGVEIRPEETREGAGGSLDGSCKQAVGETPDVKRNASGELTESRKEAQVGAETHGERDGEPRRESREDVGTVRTMVTLGKLEEERGEAGEAPSFKPSPILTSMRPFRHTRDVSSGRVELVPDSPLPYPFRRQAPFSATSSGSGVNGFTRDAATPAASPPSATPDSSGSGTGGGLGRRFSPKPRPPVSPGPAALTLSLSPTSASILPDMSTENVQPGTGRSKLAKGVTMPTVTETVSISAQREAEREAEREAARALARSAISPTNARNRTTPTLSGSSALHPQAYPFVPVVEFSPERKPPTPHNPGPRRTDTATFYQRRLGRFRGSGLPPASKTYLGRPAGFSVHVLVASAPTMEDLMAKPDSPLRGEHTMPGRAAASTRTKGLPGPTLPVPPALKAARAERALRASNTASVKPWIFYSFEQRLQVAEALRPGDVVLLTPGRYEARDWGLQHLVSSVEIIGVGAAKACVVYNNPPPTPQHSSDSHAAAEHYLVGVMGDSSAATIRGSLVGDDPFHEDVGSDIADDDSDSGWEDGTLSAAEAATTFGRAVRVRLANLTLEQGSGYRGTLYQLGHESHLELDGCVVRCSQGGVNIDQGTCLVCDCTIESSETFGVHIGGEGAVEHCTIRDCGWGGGGNGKRRVSGEAGGDLTSPASPQGGLTEAGGGGKDEGKDEDDDGTDVNRFAEGMPAISILQSSRVRVRFNVIRENAGHALQCRDALLPAGQDDERAKLVRQAETFAEETKACGIPRKIVPYLTKRYRRVPEHLVCVCVHAPAGALQQLRSWLGEAAVLLQHYLKDRRRLGSVAAEGNLCQRNRRCTQGICSDTGYGRSSNDGVLDVSKVPVGVSPVGGKGDPSGGYNGRRSSSVMWGSDGSICRSTGEEEGLPLPAVMTLRYLAAMDEGYVGSMREENARLRKRRLTELGMA